MTSLGQDTKREERTLPGKPSDRSHATARLGEEMARAQADATYQFSAVLVQCEGLSAWADRLGYASGENAWQRTMEFLGKDLQADDLCCRLSTDEFLLILSAQGHQRARASVERLRRRWQPAPGTRDAEIQINIGIASYPTHGCKIQELLRAADEALDADRLRNQLLRSPTPAAPLSTPPNNAPAMMAMH